MHKARKRFGQNFLVDTAKLDSIIYAINPQAQQNFIEIGPGTGALTRLLLPSGAKLTALEIDRDLISGLRVEFFRYENFTLLETDALKHDFSQLLQTPVRIVGNLPYNIATNLIINFWKMPNIIDMHFMLQTEVAERLTAELGDANYGRLSILSQYFCDAEIIIDFPPESFSPPPKVNSSFIKIIPKPQEQIDLQLAEALGKTLRIAFAQRRKTLANNLKNYINAEDIENLGINPKLRPQNLTLAEYLTLTKYFIKTDFSNIK